MQVETFSYDNKIVRYFTYATIIWGAVGMLVGVIIALQIFLPGMNFGISWLTYGALYYVDECNAALEYWMA